MTIDPSVLRSAAAQGEELDGLRERILAAAEGAFFERGFHATVMDTIARRAGCSKKTIYKLFESKDALFSALLQRVGRDVRAIPVDATLPPTEALCDFLQALARVILRGTSVALTRMVMAEVARGRDHTQQACQPDIGTRSRLALEDYLDWLQRQGEYEFGVPALASRMLVGMALGAFHHEVLIGVLEEVPEPVLIQRIQQSVRVFLRGSGAGGAAHDSPG
jgi:TetR/AcrR family transcriptional repressor of mexJK operon